MSQQSLHIQRLAEQPIVFYEGDEETEPFTPFLALLGPQGRVMTFGFAANEGAYYITSYDATTWQERNISNGFQPTDPQWECDQTPETSTFFSADATKLVRACADGAVTVFALHDAVPMYHQAAPSGDVGLGARAPVAAFSPDGRTLALTDDGPAGPGQVISLLDTSTWQVRRALTLPGGILSRPAWSPDGTRLAVLTLDGTLTIWDAATGAEIAHAPLPQYVANTAASDPDGPAPQWSPDGTALYVASTTQPGTLLSAWALHAATLTPSSTATIAAPPDLADPQLSPDGAYLFAHTAPAQGAIFTAPALRLGASFALPGALTIWTAPRALASFTLEASVVPLRIEG